MAEIRSVDTSSYTSWRKIHQSWFF